MRHLSACLRIDSQLQPQAAVEPWWLRGERGAPARAGEWQGIPVAIKTVVFQGGDDQTQSSLIVSEAAIASNLFHKNVVATYCHDVRSLMCGGVGNEEGVFKFYLLQVRLVAQYMGYMHVTRMHA